MMRFVARTWVSGPSGNAQSFAMGSFCLLVDGDLTRALCRERRLVPPGPALPQPQAGDRGHQVELGWPHVPEGGGVVDEAPVDGHPVVRPGDLADRVVEGVDANVIRGEGEHPPQLA